MSYYQIIWGYSTSDLSEKVNKEIKFGWQPLGGVCSGKGAGDKDILLQAMINNEVK